MRSLKEVCLGVIGKPLILSLFAQDYYPFGMLMPVDWLPPLEYFSISTIYPLFDSFVASEGTQDVDWYNTFLSNYVVAAPTMDVWQW